MKTLVKRMSDGRGDADERIRYIYELGKIHPLTYKHVMLMDYGFKLRFLKVKEGILNELLSDIQ